MKATIFKHVSILSALLCIPFICSSCEDPRSGYGTPFDQVEIVLPQPELPLEIPDEWISAAEITDAMKDKAQSYRDHVLGNSSTLYNGVYVYSATVNQYADTPEKLAARIAIFGFRQVYLSPGKTHISNASTWLRTFIARCTNYGIRVYALRIADNTALISDTYVDSEVALVRNYNKRVNANERFAGISADLEPHTAHDSGHPGPSLPYTWNTATNFGIGGPNDQLLRITLDRMKQAYNALQPDLSLHEAISTMYQKYFDKGQLAYGSVPQFLDAGCDWVVLMAYVPDYRSIWADSQPSLAATNVEKSVSICIKTAVNDANSSTISPRTWANLLTTVQYLREQGSQYPSFRGVDVFHWEGLEQMWTVVEE